MNAQTLAFAYAAMQVMVISRPAEYCPVTVRASRGRLSLLKPSGPPLPRKHPRGYSIPWHSGEAPIPSVGRENRPRLAARRQGQKR